MRFLTICLASLLVSMPVLADLGDLFSGGTTVSVEDAGTSSKTTSTSSSGSSVDVCKEVVSLPLKDLLSFVSEKSKIKVETDSKSGKIKYVVKNLPENCFSDDHLNFVNSSEMIEDENGDEVPAHIVEIKIKSPKDFESCIEKDIIKTMGGDPDNDIIPSASRVSYLENYKKNVKREKVRIFSTKLDPDDDFSGEIIFKSTGKLALARDDDPQFEKVGDFNYSDCTLYEKILPGGSPAEYRSLADIKLEKIATDPDLDCPSCHVGDVFEVLEISTLSDDNVKMALDIVDGMFTSWMDDEDSSYKSSDMLKALRDYMINLSEMMTKIKKKKPFDKDAYTKLYARMLKYKKFFDKAVAEGTVEALEEIGKLEESEYLYHAAQIFKYFSKEKVKPTSANNKIKIAIKSYKETIPDKQEIYDVKYEGKVVSKDYATERDSYSKKVANFGKNQQVTTMMLDKAAENNCKKRFKWNQRQRDEEIRCYTMYKQLAQQYAVQAQKDNKGHQELAQQNHQLYQTWLQRENFYRTNNGETPNKIVEYKNGFNFSGWSGQSSPQQSTSPWQQQQFSNQYSFNNNNNNNRGYNAGLTFNSNFNNSWGNNNRFPANNNGYNSNGYNGYNQGFPSNNSYYSNPYGSRNNAGFNLNFGGNRQPNPMCRPPMCYDV